MPKGNKTELRCIIKCDSHIFDNPPSNPRQKKIPNL
jgi:hypothetical protein